MQLAARAAILCAALCIVGIFLPAGQISVRTPLTTHTRAASLYDLGASKGAAKDFLHKYRGSIAKRIGAKALDKVAAKLHGRLGDGAADVQDAMATLDELKDEDVDTVGAIIVAVMWSLIGLNLLIAALVYRVDAASGRVRIAAAAVVAVLTAVVAVAVYLVLGRVVSEANGEIGRALFSLRGGAYMMPLAALGSLLAVGALVVDYVRTRARFRAAAAAPAVAASPP